MHARRHESINCIHAVDFSPNTLPQRHASPNTLPLPEHTSSKACLLKHTPSKPSSPNTHSHSQPFPHTLSQGHPFIFEHTLSQWHPQWHHYDILIVCWNRIWVLCHDTVLNNYCIINIMMVSCLSHAFRSCNLTCIRFHAYSNAWKHYLSSCIRFLTVTLAETDTLPRTHTLAATLPEHTFSQHHSPNTSSHSHPSPTTLSHRTIPRTHLEPCLNLVSWYGIE